MFESGAVAVLCKSSVIAQVIASLFCFETVPIQAFFREDPDNPFTVFPEANYVFIFFSSNLILNFHFLFCPLLQVSSGGLGEIPVWLQIFAFLGSLAVPKRKSFFPKNYCYSLYHVT